VPTLCQFTNQNIQKPMHTRFEILFVYTGLTYFSMIRALREKIRAILECDFVPTSAPIQTARR
jgi:hypothetical protein